MSGAGPYAEGGQLDWRRAKACSGGQCVEVANTGDVVLVRDSKNPGNELRFSASAWEEFTQGVLGGELGA